MKRTACLAVILAISAAGLTAFAGEDQILLKPSYQDFFQEAKFVAPEPGMDTALEWARPPAVRAGAGGLSSYTPRSGSEIPRLINNFEIYSSAVLTENSLAGGGSLSIEAEGAGGAFSYIVDPLSVADLAYYKFNVKTSGTVVSGSEDFTVTSLGYRRTLQTGFLKGGALLAEYRFMNDDVDNTHYLSVTSNRSMSENLSGTLGLEFVNSGTGDGGAGVVMGARYALTPDLQAFAMYSGADPMKFLYNNHMLQAAPGVRAISCTDCDKESLNLGFTWRLGSNMALNISGQDLLDMSFTATSFSYVVKQ